MAPQWAGRNLKAASELTSGGQIMSLISLIKHRVQERNIPHGGKVRSRCRRDGCVVATRNKSCGCYLKYSRRTWRYEYNPVEFKYFLKILQTWTLFRAPSPKPGIFPWRTCRGFFLLSQNIWAEGRCPRGWWGPRWRWPCTSPAAAPPPPGRRWRWSSRRWGRRYRTGSTWRHTCVVRSCVCLCDTLSVGGCTDRGSMPHRAALTTWSH